MNGESQPAEVRMVKDGVAAANETLRSIPASTAGHQKPEVKPVGASANTGYKHA
jgi:hypothetical protein